MLSINKVIKRINLFLVLFHCRYCNLNVKNRLKLFRILFLLSLFFASYLTFKLQNIVANWKQQSNWSKIMHNFFDIFEIVLTYFKMHDSMLKIALLNMLLWLLFSCTLFINWCLRKIHLICLFGIELNIFWTLVNSRIALNFVATLRRN